VTFVMIFFLGAWGKRKKSITKITKARRGEKGREGKGARATRNIPRVGKHPPVEVSGWTFRGIAAQDRFVIALDYGAAAQSVHIRSQYFNHKGEMVKLPTPVMQQYVA
jgi:hypothetical protein